VNNSYGMKFGSMGNSLGFPASVLSSTGGTGGSGGSPAILLEDGAFYLLLEDGSKILLE